MSQGARKKASKAPPKKWPTVETGLGPRERSAAQLLRGEGLRAADVRRPLPWASADRICPLLRGTSGGVLIIGFSDDTVAVVKASSSSAQELFAALLGKNLQVRVPEVRLVDSEEEERALILEYVPALLSGDVYMSSRIHSWLLQSSTLIIEPAMKMVSLDKLNPEDRPAAFSDVVLEELGLILAFDLLLSNPDRMPLGTVWPHGGNSGNLMFDLKRGVMAIDQLCIFQTDDNLRERYLSELRNLLSSMDALREGLVETIEFLKTGRDDAITFLMKGLQTGFRRIARLKRKTLVEIREKIQSTVSLASSEKQFWKGSLEMINLDYISEIAALVSESPVALSGKSDGVIDTRLFRIESKVGLADTVLKAIDTEDNIALFFDFDRTLTNGFSSAEDEDVEKRIRGGQATTVALQKALDSRIPLFVITARSPRKLVVQQLLSSFRGAQRELGEILISQDDDEVDDIEEIVFSEVPLALSRKAKIYAADYQKPTAIAHALIAQMRISEKTTVMFFDDNAINAHDVGSRISEALSRAGRSDVIDLLKVKSYWWDCFLEETGPNASMKPIRMSSSDFVYHDYFQSQLSDFGISQEERRRRAEVYKKISPPKDDAKKSKPKVGKLNVNTDAQTQLASFLFGGGKKAARQDGDLKNGRK